MARPATDEDIQRSLLVHLELKEVTDRLKTEGMSYREIVAGMASLASEIIAGETNMACASAWFFAMAKNAATVAARDLP